MDVNGWFALIGPAKMPPALVKRLHGAVVAAFATPEAVEAMAQQQNIIKPMSPEASRSYFETELNRTARMVVKAGVVLD